MSFGVPRGYYYALINQKNVYKNNSTLQDFPLSQGKIKAKFQKPYAQRLTQSIDMNNDSIIDRFKSKTNMGSYRNVRESNIFQAKKSQEPKHANLPRGQFIRQGRNRPVTSHSIVIERSKQPIKNPNSVNEALQLKSLDTDITNLMASIDSSEAIKEEALLKEATSKAINKYKSGRMISNIRPKSGNLYVKQPQNLFSPKNFTKVSNTNIGEFLNVTKGHSDKCIGCAQCLSHQHRLISYNYPKNTQSRYFEQFTNEATKPFGRNSLNQSQQFDQRVSFNYDQVRNKLKKDYQDQLLTEPESIERQYGQTIKNDTTNRIEFYMKGKSKARHDILNSTKYIKEKQKQGSSVLVPMNCFTGSTAYRDKFEKHENAVRAYPVIPPQQNIGGQQFRAMSAYAHEMNSPEHHKRASGQILLDSTKEQQIRTKKLGAGQRQGTLTNQGATAKFQDETAQGYAQKSRSPGVLTTQYKPQDNLCCVPAKVLAVSHQQREFISKRVNICHHARSKKKATY